jgi:hypothetical protein
MKKGFEINSFREFFGPVGPEPFSDFDELLPKSFQNRISAHNNTICGETKQLPRHMCLKGMVKEPLKVEFGN